MGIFLTGLAKSSKVLDPEKLMSFDASDFYISPAASSIPVGCEMIQICQWCQSLQKITCFKKNDGVTSQTLAVSRYSRWRSRWPTNHTTSYFSGTIDSTDVILVSSIWFSGSGNPKNKFNSFPIIT